MSFVRLGMWLWGGALAVLVLAVLTIMIGASLSVAVSANGVVTTSGAFARAYYVIRDCSQLLAAMITVVGVAWSFFFSKAFAGGSTRKSDS